MSPTPAIRTNSRVAEVSWFAPLCNEDYEYLGVPDPAFKSTFEHCADILLSADRLGFDNILCPSSYQVGQDTLLFAAGVATRTRRINLLTAVRCGELHPLMLARSIATLDHMLQGRLTVNIISSDMPGETLESAKRYLRSREVVEILRACWSKERVNYEGEFYQFHDVPTDPVKPYQQNGGPLLSLTARAQAPEGLRKATSLSLTPSARDAHALEGHISFDGGTRTEARLHALGGDAFVLEIGDGPSPSHDALRAWKAPSPGKAAWDGSGGAFSNEGIGFTTGVSHSGTVAGQFSFSRAGTALLTSVGEDYNFGNIPVRFPLFRHEGAGGFGAAGFGLSLGLTHGERIYGCGEDFGPLLKNGRVFDFLNADALGVNGRERYQSTPTFHSSHGWSMTVLSREPSVVDVGESRSEIVTVSSSGPRLRVLFQFAPLARARVSQLRALLAGSWGFLPPREGVPSCTSRSWLSRLWRS